METIRFIDLFCGVGGFNMAMQDNQEYWLKKITGNQERDVKADEYLKLKGWQVIRVWECELTKKNEQLLQEKLEPLLKTP